MKTSRITLAISLLALLAGIGVWKDQPCEGIAPNLPLSTASIEVPKMPAVSSATTVPASLTPPSPPPPVKINSLAGLHEEIVRREATLAQERQRNEQARADTQTPRTTQPQWFGAAASNTPVFDLGKVELADGIPQDFILEDGTTVTVTATANATGIVYLKIDTPHPDSSAPYIGVKMVTGAKNGEEQIVSLIGPRSYNPGTPAATLKLTPHVN